MIPLYGIEGAAAATALVWLMGAIVTGSIIYLMYGMNPYKGKVLLATLIVVALFGLNSLIQFQGHFILTAAAKTIALPAVALFLIYRLNLSDDIKSMLNKLFARLKRP
jgi:hypothetical protein